MGNYMEHFRKLLEWEEREESLTYILELLEENKMDIIQVYTQILIPSLQTISCNLEDKNMCIWKEHIRRGIVRTIVECCFPYVMARKKQWHLPYRGSAIVMCPPEEYDDLHARMFADFYEICGFDAMFMGSNTPYKDFYNALETIKPSVVFISVNNYYNLVSTKKIICDLKEKSEESMKIIVGGYAFSHHEDNWKRVDADGYVTSYEDIERITRKEVEV